MKNPNEIKACLANLKKAAQQITIKTMDAEAAMNNLPEAHLVDLSYFFSYEGELEDLNAAHDALVEQLMKEPEE